MAVFGETVSQTPVLWVGQFEVVALDTAGLSGATEGLNLFSQRYGLLTGTSSSAGIILLDGAAKISPSSGPWTFQWLSANSMKDMLRQIPGLPDKQREIIAAQLAGPDFMSHELAHFRIADFLVEGKLESMKKVERLANAAAWLAEGAACFHESDKARTRRLTELKQSLGTKRWIPLERLLRIPSPAGHHFGEAKAKKKGWAVRVFDSDSIDSEKGLQFYNESLGLLLFLQELAGDRWNTVMKNLANGISSEQVFPLFMEIRRDPASIEKRWEQWIRSRSF